MNTHAPKQTDWWVWGGAAVAAIVVIAALGYSFGWFGLIGDEVALPAIEQVAPVTE